tara:strand:+ start:235 stop:984 length:750 start_codon:yes stop_codon:yes gene_type:complete
MKKLLLYTIISLIFTSFSFTQNTCENNCGSGTLQEYWNGQVDCVCNLDCAGYGDACCDYYNACYENPSNLEYSDFLGTWHGNITNDQTWAYDDPITIVIETNNQYSVTNNPGGHLISSSYPGTEEVHYNSASNILSFQWVLYYHYSCGGPCYTSVPLQVMEFGNGEMTLFYNNSSGPAPQANSMYLTLENFTPELTGDVNFDGTVNVSDVVVTVNIVLGISPFEELADLNVDGTINIQDIILLVNIILG